MSKEYLRIRGSGSLLIVLAEALKERGSCRKRRRAQKILTRDRLAEHPIIHRAACAYRWRCDRRIVWLSIVWLSQIKLPVPKLKCLTPSTSRTRLWVQSKLLIRPSGLSGEIEMLVEFSVRVVGVDVMLNNISRTLTSDA